jgi:hypothetical protein
MVPWGGAIRPALKPTHPSTGVDKCAHTYNGQIENMVQYCPGQTGWRIS